MVVLAPRHLNAFGGRSAVPFHRSQIALIPLLVRIVRDSYPRNSQFIFFPSRSTDFEVHRNWLAITHSLPISQWYYDVGDCTGTRYSVSDGFSRLHRNGVSYPTTNGTPRAHSSAPALDYPPFFAYFEKVLSVLAAYVDPAIVDLHNLDYDTWSVVTFQRTTVILTELLLGAALLRSVYTTRIYFNNSYLTSRFLRGAVNPSRQRLLSASLLFHPGFIIIDHIHFQYNGFLFGILLWSILMARDVSG